MNTAVVQIFDFPKRTCKLCGVVKSIEKFRRSGIRSADGKVYREHACADCRKILEKRPEQKAKATARRKVWRDANPVLNYESHTKSRLKRQYGITLEAAKAMLVAQHGICANVSCGKPLEFAPSSRKRDAKPIVDHCHATGAVRGIICDGCNKALGHAKDSPQILMGLADYVRRQR